MTPTETGLNADGGCQKDLGGKTMACGGARSLTGSFFNEIGSLVEAGNEF